MFLGNSDKSLDQAVELAFGHVELRFVQHRGADVGDEPGGPVHVARFDERLFRVATDGAKKRQLGDLFRHPDEERSRIGEVLGVQFLALGHRLRVFPLALHNPDFKPLEFEGFRKEVGLNSFTMSPTKWIEGVNAVGMAVQSGRYV